MVGARVVHVDPHGQLRLPQLTRLMAASGRELISLLRGSVGPVDALVGTRR